MGVKLLHWIYINLIILKNSNVILFVITYMQESCHLLILKYLDCGQLLGYTRDLKFAVGSYVYEQLFKIFLGTAF